MSTPGAYLRLARAGWIMVREGVIAALLETSSTGFRSGWRMARLLARRRSKNRDRSERLSEAVARLGPSTSSSGNSLPPVRMSSARKSRSTSRNSRTGWRPSAGACPLRRSGSIGRPLGDIFVSLGEPVAAASIAQVHPAEVETDGIVRKVAVKVIRPVRPAGLRRDLETYFLVARMQERYVPATRRLRPVQVAETLAQTTRLEMDLRLEAAALSEIGENTAADPVSGSRPSTGKRHGRDVLHDRMDRRREDVRRRGSPGCRPRPAGLAATLIQSFLTAIR